MTNKGPGIFWFGLLSVRNKQETSFSSIFYAYSASWKSQLLSAPIKTPQQPFRALIPSYGLSIDPTWSILTSYLPPLIRAVPEPSWNNLDSTWAQFWAHGLPGDTVARAPIPRKTLENWKILPEVLPCQNFWKMIGKNHHNSLFGPIWAGTTRIRGVHWGPQQNRNALMRRVDFDLGGGRV